MKSNSDQVLQSLPVHLRAFDQQFRCNIGDYIYLCVDLTYAAPGNAGDLQAGLPAIDDG